MLVSTCRGFTVEARGFVNYYDAQDFRDNVVALTMHRSSCVRDQSHEVYTVRSDPHLIYN